MSALSFRIEATDGAARTGVIALPRGEIRTPAFMPLGTAGAVKALTVDQVASAGADKLVRDAIIWTHIAGDAVQRMKVLSFLLK